MCGYIHIVTKFKPNLITKNPLQKINKTLKN